MGGTVLLRNDRLRDEFRTLFGNNLRRIRVLRGMTQAQLEYKAGYSGNGALSQIEQGLKGMPINRVYSVAKALKVHPSFLMAQCDYSDDDIETIINFHDLMLTGTPQNISAIRQIIKTMIPGGITE